MEKYILNYTGEEINNLLRKIELAPEDISTLKFEIVEKLPVTDINSSTIYLIKTKNNDYEEYIYINNKWEMLGSTKLDLTNYATKTDVENAINELDVYSKSETDAKILADIKAKVPDGTQLRVHGHIVYKTEPASITAELLETECITWIDAPRELPTTMNHILSILASGEIWLDREGNTIEERIAAFSAEDEFCTINKEAIAFTGSDGSSYSDAIDILHELSMNVIGYYDIKLGFVYIDISVSGATAYVDIITSTGTFRYKINPRDNKPLVSRLTYTPSVLADVNVLSKTNTREYTPIEDYNPATKKYVDDSIANIDLPEINTSYTLPAIGEIQEIETLEGKYTLQVIENAVLSRMESVPIADNSRVEGIMSSDFCEFPTYLENTSFYMTVNGNTQLIAFGPGEGIIDMDMFEVAPIFQEKIDAVFGANQVKVIDMVLPFGFQIGFESADDVSNHIIVTSGGDTDTLELLYIASGSTNRLNMSLTIGEFLQTDSTEMIVTLGARDNRAHSINPQTMTLQGFFDWLNALPVYNFHISYETQLDKIVVTRMNGDVLFGDNLYFFNGLGLIDGINMSAEQFEAIKQYDSKYSEQNIIIVDLTKPNGTIVKNISLTNTEFAFDGNLALTHILNKIEQENLAALYATKAYVDSKVAGDTTEPGAIKIFSNVEDRDGYLLCNGTEVFNIDYPTLQNKLRTYDVYRAATSQQVIGSNTYYNMIAQFPDGSLIARTNTTGESSYYTSFDGITWHKTNITLASSSYNLDGLAYQNGIYVFSESLNGSVVSYASTNLINWSAGTTSTGTNVHVRALVGGNGVFMIYGCTGSKASSETFLRRSTDGVTWESLTNKLLTNTQISGIIFGLGKFINYSNTKFFCSTDGQNYESINQDATYYKTNLQGYGDYIYARESSTYNLVRSKDLQNWEVVVNVADTPFSSGNYTFAVCDDGIYILISSKLYYYDFTTTQISTLKISLETPSLGVGSASRTSDGYLFKFHNKKDCYFTAGDKEHSTTSAWSVAKLTHKKQRLVLPTMNDSTNQIYGYIKY